MRKPEVFQDNLCEDGSRFECIGKVYQGSYIPYVHYLYKQTFPNGSTNYYMNKYHPKNSTVLVFGGEEISDDQRKNELTLLCEVLPDGQEICHNPYGLTSKHLNKVSRYFEGSFDPKELTFSLNDEDISFTIKNGKITGQRGMDPFPKHAYIENRYYSNGNLAERAYLEHADFDPYDGGGGYYQSVFETYYTNGKPKSISRLSGSDRYNEYGEKKHYITGKLYSGKEDGTPTYIYDVYEDGVLSKKLVSDNENRQVDVKSVQFDDSGRLTSVTFSNGTYVQFSNWEMDISKSPDGIIRKWIHGKVFEEIFPDGKEIRYLDGRKYSEKFPDGKEIKYNSNEEINEEKFPDGRVVGYDWHNPHIKTYEKLLDGKKIWYYDGKAKKREEFPDGRIVEYTNDSKNSKKYESLPNRTEELWYNSNGYVCFHKTKGKDDTEEYLKKCAIKKIAERQAEKSLKLRKHAKENGKGPKTIVVKKLNPIQKAIAMKKEKKRIEF